MYAQSQVLSPPFFRSISAIHRSCRPILSLCLRPLADLIGLARYVACTLKLRLHHDRDLELSDAMRLLWL